MPQNEAQIRVATIRNPVRTSIDPQLRTIRSLANEKDGLDPDQYRQRMVTEGKTLARIKQQLVPKKELVAALCAARLMNNTKKFLRLECRTFFWTDSRNVYYWI